MIRKVLALMGLMVFTIFPLMHISAQTHDLSIISVQPHSLKEVDITFSQEIVLSTLRVLIEDQVTRDIIPVKTYQEGNDSSIARIVLDADMYPNRSYKLTVNTVTSVEGGTINAGVDAIREFSTSDNLSNGSSQETSSSSEGHSFDSASSEVPTSQIDANSQTGSTHTESTQTPKGDEKKSTEPKANALPATGMELWLVLGLMAIGCAGLFMKHKKRF